jgi:hypothetical protein
MWQAAANVRLGTIVRTNGSMREKVLLYEYRKLLGNPAFTNLQIRFSPDNADNALWIIKTPEPEPQLNSEEIPA